MLYYEDEIHEDAKYLGKKPYDWGENLRRDYAESPVLFNLYTVIVTEKMAKMNIKR